MVQEIVSSLSRCQCANFVCHVQDEKREHIEEYDSKRPQIKGRPSTDFLYLLIHHVESNRDNCVTLELKQ